MKFSSLILGAVGLLLSTLASAHDYTVGTLAISHPYARATAAGQVVGGGYLKLENKGKVDDKLLSISVAPAVSKSVELHSMTMAGDVAQMREVSSIEIPAGKTVELKPGGLHVMFVGLAAPLKVGAKFAATLKFEKAGEVKVEFQVDAIDTKGHVH
jgi:copper(I)-binding protein